MGFNSRNNVGNTKYRKRAKEIYAFALGHPGNFRQKEIPHRKPYESEAMSLLIERGLIGYGCRSRNVVTYKVLRRVPVEDCLELNAAMPSLKGCKVYKVPVGVAETMGASPQLEQYAISKVTQW